MKRSLICLLCALAVLAIVRLSRVSPGAVSHGSSDVASTSQITREEPSATNSETFAAGSAAENAPNHLVQSDVTAAVALSKQLPAGDRQRDLTLQLLKDLFEKDPALAADLVAQLPAPLDWQMASALASMWAEKDAKGVVEWATNLPRGPVRSQALVSLCGDWAKADPQAAANFVFNSAETEFPLGNSDTASGQQSDLETSSRIRIQMLETIAARWTEKDSGAAGAWAAQLPAGSSRDAFLAGISSALGESAPEETAALVASMEPGPHQNDAALTVLLEWGRENFASAGDWLKLFPPGDFRQKALLDLSAGARETDPESATSFLLAWSEPDERTQAIHHYLTEILDLDAAQGTNLLAGIDDPVLRLEETERLAQHWLTQDPLAATAWISHLPLEEP